MSYAQSQTGGMNQEDRPKSDFYQTPEYATRKLLEVETFDKYVWEPACGAGAIAKILEENGYDVYATDLYDHDYGISGVDFLEPTFNNQPYGTDIITNPPFSQALEFAQQGVKYIENSGGRMAFLCRLAWLESQKRHDFFQESPLRKVWVFSKRLPMMHRPGYEGKKSSSTIAFAWYIWQAGWNRAPEIGWLL